MDADPHQWHQQNDGNGQWKDYSTGWAQYNTTPVHEYEGLVKLLSPYLPELMEPPDCIKDEVHRNAFLNWCSPQHTCVYQTCLSKTVSFSELNSSPFKGHHWLRFLSSYGLELHPMDIFGETASHEYVANSPGFHS